MQVSFTIDDSIMGQLDVIARDQNRSRSQLIKVLIKDYLMKYNYTSKIKCISCENVLVTGYSNQCAECKEQET